jgi:hypothetical protein
MLSNHVHHMTYRTDNKAPTTANTPPVTGKYSGIDRFRNAPTNKLVLSPKANPGSRVGNNTPNDIPTHADINARTQQTTMARSNPTGTKSGSRKTYVMNPDINADSMPAKYRVSLPFSKRQEIQRYEEVDNGHRIHQMIHYMSEHEIV